MRWVLTHKESGAAKGRIVLIGYEDPADALTKPLPPGVLQKSLIEGSWTLGYDPDFTSAKKLRKKQGMSDGATWDASHGQGFWGILESEVDRFGFLTCWPPDASSAQNP